MPKYISTSSDRNRLGNIYKTYGPVSILYKSGTPATKRAALKYRKQTGKKRMPVSVFAANYAPAPKAGRVAAPRKATTRSTTKRVNPIKAARIAAAKPTKRTVRVVNRAKPTKPLKVTSAPRARSVKVTATPKRTSTLRVSSAPRRKTTLRVR